MFEGGEHEGSMETESERVSRQSFVLIVYQQERETHYNLRRPRLSITRESLDGLRTDGW